MKIPSFNKLKELKPFFFIAYITVLCAFIYFLIYLAFSSIIMASLNLLATFVYSSMIIMHRKNATRAIYFFLLTFFVHIFY